MKKDLSKIEVENSNLNRTSEDQFGYRTDLIHDLLRTVGDESASLDQIRKEIEFEQKMKLNLFDLLELHHRFIKQSLVVLLQKDSGLGLKEHHLNRVLILTKMHLEAEETTLYRKLLKSELEDARLEGLCGSAEHDMIQSLIEQLESIRKESLWNEEIEALTRVFATSLIQHFQEEESEIFKCGLAAIATETSELLAQNYLQLCLNELSLHKLRHSDEEMN